MIVRDSLIAVGLGALVAGNLGIAIAFWLFAQLAHDTSKLEGN